MPVIAKELKRLPFSEAVCIFKAAVLVDYPLKSPDIVFSRYGADRRIIEVTRGREKGKSKEEVCGRIVWQIYADLAEKNPYFLVGINAPARSKSVFASEQLEECLQFLSDIKKYL